MRWLGQEGLREPDGKNWVELTAERGDGYGRRISLPPPFLGL
jgi:hypothetical protein